MERCARKPSHLSLQIGEDPVPTLLTQFIESPAEIRVIIHGPPGAGIDAGSTALPHVCSSPMLFRPTKERSYPTATVIQLEYAVCCCIARTSRRLRNVRGPIVLNSNLRDAAIRHRNGDRRDNKATAAASGVQESPAR